MEPSKVEAVRRFGENLVHIGGHCRADTGLIWWSYSAFSFAVRSNIWYGISMTNWNSFEDRTREIASLIWASPCRPEQLEGVRFDGVIRLGDGRLILIEITVENTLKKVRLDIAKFGAVRLALFAKNTFSECFLVMGTEPTESMVLTGSSVAVKVMSLATFEKQFFDAPSYKMLRMRAPFGSAVHPETGKAVQNVYVPVGYYDRDSKKDISLQEIAQKLRTGSRILLTGEYGTGKSRCIQELFPILAETSTSPNPGSMPFPIPIAINLREQWGLRSAQEIIRRHFSDLAISSAAENVIRALRLGAFCLLLDGFDELGAQVWSEDPRKIRQIRRESLEGVRQLVQQCDGSIFLSGREHYFNSDEEALDALGLTDKSVVMLASHEEFSHEQMKLFVESISSDVEMPVWLPRRPLVAQVLSSLAKDDLDNLLAEDLGEVTFWDHFMSVVCKRESLIKAGLDPDSVRGILRRLSVLTRGRLGNTGPISLDEISQSFEAEVGSPPVDESALILHRLPGLGRVQADTNDRRFADSYILNGLRADHVAICAKDRGEADAVARLNWSNPLTAFGQRIAGEQLRIGINGVRTAVALAATFAQRGNNTLAADIACSLLAVAEDDEAIDFAGLKIVGACSSTVDLSRALPAGLHLKELVFETLIMPGRAMSGATVSGLANRIVGVSSPQGMPAWARVEAEQYDSILTNTHVRASNLSANHKILYTIIHKTFFQRGSARKETSLFRGLAQLDTGGMVAAVVKILIAENVIECITGRDGFCYKPIRKHTRRMRKVLDELKLSADPIWKAVANI